MLKLFFKLLLKVKNELLRKLKTVITSGGGKGIIRRKADISKDKCVRNVLVLEMVVD